MKKILLFMILSVLSLSLIACEKDDDSENPFRDLYQHKVNTYYEAETGKTKYVVFYYDSTTETCGAVNADIIAFFQEFTLLDYYVLDISKIETEKSSFPEFTDSVVYVVSNGVIQETYLGCTEIETFISTYEELEITIDLFSDQHRIDIEMEVDESNLSTAYLVYNPDHNEIDTFYDLFLPFSYGKTADDIFFYNIFDVDHLQSFDGDIDREDIINEPVLYILNNKGDFVEKYIGLHEIEIYMKYLGSREIQPVFSMYSYNDFADHKVSDYSETLIDRENIYIEYYYSPFCSHCNMIKPYILGFFDEHPEIEFYLVNVSDTSGVVKIEEYHATPSLFIIKDGKVVDSFVGSNAIPQFVSDYNDGLIDLEDYE